MTDTLFDRKLVTTTLDDVPRGMRTAPGVLAVTAAEKEAVAHYDVPTIKRLLAYIIEDDILRAEKAGAP